jgi:SAM-dependent methyltransferase
MKSELSTIYRNRFAGREQYRRSVWQILIASYFEIYLRGVDSVLDLGCGYCDFINQVSARERFGMDLNPDASQQVGPGVRLLSQDCSSRWPLADRSLDLVFTSNFFEHLPDKASLTRTLGEIHRCLKPGGRLVAMGPNLKYLTGRYWDFWDHYLPLTEQSLAEGLSTGGFEIERMIDRFLPFTMSQGPRYPLAFLRLYLRLPLAWKVFGKQFLVVGAKPTR